MAKTTTKKWPKQKTTTKAPKTMTVNGKKYSVWADPKGNGYAIPEQRVDTTLSIIRKGDLLRHSGRAMGKQKAFGYKVPGTKNSWVIYRRNA